MPRPPTAQTAAAVDLASLLHLCILLVAARLIGRLATALHQPASIGEILAGALLALLLLWLPADLPLVAGLSNSPAIEWAGAAGIFALLLLTGIEMEPQEIIRHMRETSFVAAGGVILPLFLGFAAGWLLLPDNEFKLLQAFVIGVLLSISAIPIAAKVFMELGLLHRLVGEVVIGAALIDDVIGLFLLALVTSVLATGQMPDAATLLLLLLQVAAFFAITTLAGRRIFPRLWTAIRSERFPHLTATLLLGLALLFGLLAELLGLHFVLGPCVAGLFFDPETAGQKTYDKVKQGVSLVTMGILAPIFFAWIGLQLDLRGLAGMADLLLILIAAALAGKILGAGLPAKLAGMSGRDALAVGVGLSGRGAVELVVLSLAQESGVFAPAVEADPAMESLFSALVLTALVTTFLVPVLLRIILGPRPPGPSPGIG